METQVFEGASRLLDYGVLGILVFVLFWFISRQNKKHDANIERMMKDKDQQISDWRNGTEKRDQQIDGVLAQISKNSTQIINNSSRLIDLYDHQQQAIKEIPDRTVEKLLLAKK